MPRPSLRRRFGPEILQQLDKALGQEMEILEPVQPVEPYQERLPCMDPVLTLPGIELALQKLLEKLCNRLQADQKGLRSAVFKGFRVDGKIISIEIGTSRPSHHVTHLYKLFELKIPTLEPGMGIELFVIEAQKIDDYQPKQEKMWDASGGLEDIRLAELLDRLAGKISEQSIHRFLPDEHYWPERSVREAVSLEDKSNANWHSGFQRPVQLLPAPEKIEVTAPIPDYPPMLFRHKGKIHKIVRADGPERIEQEWWIQQGQHRDYYCVEDEEGKRYWLFRLGHYDDKVYQWFIHGFFA
jgi:protein ImuB